MTNAAKQNYINEFEEALNTEYKEAIMQEQDPNFQKMLKKNKNKQRSLVNQQMKQMLFEHNFKPEETGDTTIMLAFLKQLNIFNQVKKNYNTWQI